MQDMQRQSQDLRVPAESGAAIDATEETIDAGEDRDRLEQLPEHERDADTSIGGGVVAAGGTAEQRGPSQRVDEGDEDLEAEAARTGDVEDIPGAVRGTPHRQL